MNLCRNVEKTSASSLLPASRRYPNVYRFIVRDFVYSEEEVEKQQHELSTADTTEKELWVGIFKILDYLPLNSVYSDRTAALVADQLL